HISADRLHRFRQTLLYLLLRFHFSTDQTASLSEPRRSMQNSPLHFWNESGNCVRNDNPDHRADENLRLPSYKAVRLPAFRNWKHHLSLSSGATWSRLFSPLLQSYAPVRKALDFPALFLLPSHRQIPGFPRTVLL